MLVDWIATSFALLTPRNDEYFTALMLTSFGSLVSVAQRPTQPGGGGNVFS